MKKTKVLYSEDMTELEQLQGYLRYLRLYPIWKNNKERKRIKNLIELQKRPALICELCKEFYCIHSRDNCTFHRPSRRMLLKSQAGWPPHLLCREFLMSIKE